MRLMQESGLQGEVVFGCFWNHASWESTDRCLLLLPSSVVACLSLLEVVETRKERGAGITQQGGASAGLNLARQGGGPRAALQPQATNPYLEPPQLSLMAHVALLGSHPRSLSVRPFRDKDSGPTVRLSVLARPWAGHGGPRMG